MEEMVDVVDRNGNVLGVVEKSEAHRKGLLHRVVHVWIINSNGEVLLQRRSGRKKVFPNTWDISAAGHVSAGEQSLKTAQRETMEEIGLNLDESKFKYMFSYIDTLICGSTTINDYADVYVVRENVDISKLNIQKQEVAEIKWMPLNTFFDHCFGKNFCPHTKGFRKMKQLFGEKSLG